MKFLWFLFLRWMVLVYEWRLEILAGAFVLMGLLWLFGRVPIGYNVRNLMVRWRTTMMTALAFTVVVALMTVMLAFVNGMRQLTENSGRPENVIVLADGSTDEQFSSMGFTDVADVERQRGVLRDAQDRPLSSKETYLVVNQPIPEKAGEKRRRRFVQLRGIEEPQLAAQVHAINLYPNGKWFSDAGVEELPGAPRDSQDNVVPPKTDASNSSVKFIRPASSASVIQAVIGQGLAAELGTDRPDKRPLDIGDTFELGPRTWIVTGVMQSSGSTFDSEVWAKRTLVGPLFGKETVSSMVLKTDSAASASKLAIYLKTDYKKARVTAQTEKEYYAKLSETSKQFEVAVIFIAIVMAIGGVFGVMNTMFAAISQRTKDIGVLRIIGFGRRQVLFSFLLESLVLALFGGLLGCGLGLLADGWTAKSIVSSGQGGGKSIVLHLVVDANIMATGLLLSLSMGLLGGFVPALSAMRLRPLESLR